VYFLTRVFFDTYHFLYTVIRIIFDTYQYLYVFYLTQYHARHVSPAHVYQARYMYHDDTYQPRYKIRIPDVLPHVGKCNENYFYYAETVSFLTQRGVRPPSRGEGVSRSTPLVQLPVVDRYRRDTYHDRYRRRGITRRKLPSRPPERRVSGSMCGCCGVFEPCTPASNRQRFRRSAE
jgi:hypothetical protein